MDDVTPSVVVILYSNDPALCFHSLIINASSSSSSNVLSNEAGFRRRVHCIYLSINHHACRRMKAFIQSNIQIKNSQWNSVSYSNNCRSNHRDQKMKSIITVEAKLNTKKCSKWNESSSSKKKRKFHERISLNGSSCIVIEEMYFSQNVRIQMRKDVAVNWHWIIQKRRPFWPFTQFTLRL